MVSNDAINGSFELVGAYFNSRSVAAIRRDRIVTGVCWTPWAWFSAWGVWNLFYYPSLDQFYSFLGGLVMVGVNLIWLYHVWYYKGMSWEVLKTKLRGASVGGLMLLKTSVQINIANASSWIKKDVDMISRFLHIKN